MFCTKLENFISSRMVLTMDMIKSMISVKIESTVYANKTTQGNDNTIINKLSYLLPFNNATITGYTNEQEYISNNSRRKIDRTTD